MMNKLNVILLLALALLLANKTQAQNKEVSAYIITAAGDTVQGEMKKQPSKNAISFKAAGSTTFRTYSTEDVQAFVLEGNIRYMAAPVTVQNEQQRVFMQVVVDGPVKLYYNQGLRTEADFYVQKPDKPVLQLHRQYFMGTLTSLFSECQPAARVKYNFSSLAAFISDYNACKYGYTPKTPYKSTRSVTATFGVKAGAGLTFLKLESDATKDEEGNFDSQTNFTAGLFMNFRMTGKAFSVQPELWYKKIESESSIYYARPNSGSYTSTLSVSAEQLYIPLLVRYDLGKKILKPYLYAGPAVSFVLSDEVKQVMTYDVTQQPITKELGSSSATIGFTGGAGVSYSLGNQDLLLELRYSRDVASSNLYNQHITYSTLQINAGFVF